MSERFALFSEEKYFPLHTFNAYNRMYFFFHTIEFRIYSTNKFLCHCDFWYPSLRKIHHLNLWCRMLQIYACLAFNSKFVPLCNFEKNKSKNEMSENTKTKSCLVVYFLLIFCFALKKRGPFFEILRQLHAIFIPYIFIMLSFMPIFCIPNICTFLSL